MKILPPALFPLCQYDQFILYKLVVNPENPYKLIKKPANYRNGKVWDAHDPAIWTDFKTVASVLDIFGDDHGVGFVLTENDPFFLLDIDGCITETGYSEIATELTRTLKNAAVEISSSKRGLHIIGKTSPIQHASRNDSLKLELYTKKRFIALTGTMLWGNVDSDCTAELSEIVKTYFYSSNNHVSNSLILTNKPQENWRGSTDDDQLISRALRSISAKSVFGGGATFRDLWENNENILSQVYPPNDSDLYNRSSADAALASHLAFWTGCQGERIQALMMRSRLIRDKWHRDDYLPRTINAACYAVKSVCEDKPVQALEGKRLSKVKPEIVTGNTFLSIDDQLELFAGCTYVRDAHAILVPGGDLLKPDQFRVTYGGYSFVIDFKNEKVTRDAWKCFTESQAFRAPRADSSCFDPQSAPGSITIKEQRSLVNIYWPIQTEGKEGDAGPFIRLLEKLLPVERDRMILLSYIAACVQYPGTKFRWCPLLQGVEGNGKTLISLAVTHAIGFRYSCTPRPKEIADRFNSWMFGKIFAFLEDVYIAKDRVELLEALKPMITGSWHEIEPKFQDRVQKNVCVNFILNSNHKDAVQKTQNDRRFALFYTAQQSISDLERDGMTGDYFPNLFKWLDHEGYVIITHFLKNFEIPAEFNPALLPRAPHTSSTTEAIEKNQSFVEQEILEAVEQGVLGFREGWISSDALQLLFEKIGYAKRIPQNRRRELLKNIGYDWHPALHNGRVNNPLPSGSKPKLYIKSNHPASLISNGTEIVNAYLKDQSLV